MDIEFDQSIDDRAILAEYISKINDCYVEIGTWDGGSARFATDHTDQDIYTVDIVNRYKLENPRIKFINQDSVHAIVDWDKPIGLLFIDADHNLAIADFYLWERFVVKGGYILFHDYAPHSPEVIKHCNRIVKEYGYKHIPHNTNSSIFVIQKC